MLWNLSSDSCEEPYECWELNPRGPLKEWLSVPLPTPLPDPFIPFLSLFVGLFID